MSDWVFVTIFKWLKKGAYGGIPSIHDKRVPDYFSLIAFDKRNPKGPFLSSTIGRRTIHPSIDIFCHYCVRLYTLFSPVAFILRDITHYLYHLPNNSGALYCSQASSFVQRERERESRYNGGCQLNSRGVFGIPWTLLRSAIRKPVNAFAAGLFRRLPRLLHNIAFRLTLGLVRPSFTTLREIMLHDKDKCWEMGKAGERYLTPYHPPCSEIVAIILWILSSVIFLHRATEVAERLHGMGHHFICRR